MGLISARILELLVRVAQVSLQYWYYGNTRSGLLLSLVLLLYAAVRYHIGSILTVVTLTVNVVEQKGNVPRHDSVERNPIRRHFRRLLRCWLMAMLPPLSLLPPQISPPPRQTPRLKETASVDIVPPSPSAPGAAVPLSYQNRQLTNTNSTEVAGTAATSTRYRPANRAPYLLLLGWDKPSLPTRLLENPPWC